MSRRAAGRTRLAPSSYQREFVSGLREKINKFENECGQTE